MGCNNSRHVFEMESRPIRPVTLSSHSAGSVMTPSSIFQDFPDSSELSREQVAHAFQHMGEYLNEYGVYMQCVVLDGAVNALFLRTRKTTHDVEFIIQDPASKDSMTLCNAASYANSKADGRLGEKWFNNSMQLLMARDVQISLVRDAGLQNELIFEHRGTKGGLRVVAAPWRYALCSKLDRIWDTNRSDDMDDAVAYLRRYLSIIRQEYIIGELLLDWCQKYHQNVSREVLDRFANAYFEKHENWPLLWT